MKHNKLFSIKRFYYPWNPTTSSSSYTLEAWGNKFVPYLGQTLSDQVQLNSNLCTSSPNMYIGGDLIKENVKIILDNNWLTIIFNISLWKELNFVKFPYTIFLQSN